MRVGAREPPRPRTHRPPRGPRPSTRPEPGPSACGPPAPRPPAGPSRSPRGRRRRLGAPGLTVETRRGPLHAPGAPVSRAAEAPAGTRLRLPAALNVLGGEHRLAGATEEGPSRQHWSLYLFTVAALRARLRRPATPCATRVRSPPAFERTRSTRRVARRPR